MSLTTDSGTWVLVNLRMLDASHNRLRYLGAGQPEDAGCPHNRLKYLWLVNLRTLDVSTTYSDTWVLVNLRMLNVSHNRLRYLGAGQSEDAGCLSQQTQILGCWSI